MPPRKVEIVGAARAEPTEERRCGKQRGSRYAGRGQAVTDTSSGWCDPGTKPRRGGKDDKSHGEDDKSLHAGASF